MRFLLNTSIVILVFQLLVPHLFEFALFCLDLYTIIRATWLLVFLLGLMMMIRCRPAWGDNITRRRAGRRSFPGSHSDMSRWRRRYRRYDWLRCEHSNSHAPQPCNLG